MGSAAEEREAMLALDPAAWDIEQLLAVPERPVLGREVERERAHRSGANPARGRPAT